MPDHAARTMGSPLGPITVTASPRGVRAIAFEEGAESDGPGVEHAEMAIGQLREYFAGERASFDLPLDPPGTEFQRRVWNELARIPFGETTTYATLAERLGDPNAVRAVGMANGRNPVAIVIPCHRVIGSDGGLRGYAGEVWRKEELLRLEGGGLWGAASGASNARETGDPQRTDG